LIILDTPVLVYAVGDPHPLRDAARQVVSAASRGEIPLTTTPGVLQEFVDVYARRRSRGEAAGHGRRWLALLRPLVLNASDDVPTAMRLFERVGGLNSFDAFLAAVALRENATALVSAGRAFADVPKLRFVELGSPELERLLA
jgi:predicted nucleic acid-binding protein